MSKVWYCPNCGYEVTSRGRCHACHERLVASALPELEAGEEEDEVGYRLDGWVDRDRGRLIEQLNRVEILHRFENDELVIAADDESRVDDLVAEVAASPEDDGSAEDGWSAEGGYSDGGAVAGDRTEADGDDERVAAAVAILAAAAGRLARDPTDMQADADVAEASAAVFMVDVFYGADVETWAAVGRVTRRLLAALGADEALEDEIRSQAAVLDKLLEPFVQPRPGQPQPRVQPHPEAPPPVGVVLEGVPAVEGVPAAPEAPGAVVHVEAVVTSGDAGDDVETEDGDEGTETVYELPEWLPEQRAQLGILLESANISYEWDGDDLVVPVEREAEVESLFDRVGAPTEIEDDDDDGTRYRSLEELFAAAARLVNDPTDEHRAADVIDRIKEAAGPPPFGLDEVAWFRIMTQARALSEAIGADRDGDVLFEEAKALRDLLREIV